MVGTPQSERAKTEKEAGDERGRQRKKTAPQGTSNMAETMSSSKQQIREIERRVASLQQVWGEAYQLAGAGGAPVKALDNLAAAASMPHATFLPVSAADCDKFAGGRGA